MRAILLAAVSLCAMPAAAHSGPDGRAIGTSGVSEIGLAHGSVPLTIERLRRLMQEMISHQMKPEDIDLLGELAVGHSVQVSAG